MSINTGTNPYLRSWNEQVFNRKASVAVFLSADSPCPHRPSLSSQFHQAAFKNWKTVSLAALSAFLTRVSTVMNTVCIAGLSPGCNRCPSYRTFSHILSLNFCNQQNLYSPQRLCNVPHDKSKDHYWIILWINSSTRRLIIHRDLCEVNNKRFIVWLGLLMFVKTSGHFLWKVFYCSEGALILHFSQRAKLRLPAASCASAVISCLSLPFHSMAFISCRNLRGWGGGAFWTQSKHLP